MHKPHRPKTTESSRRHAFASFRERIDSIKIEPNLNLNKRAHDYVESSHLLATLEHWKEVNISGNFTECLDKIEIHSQSLPQILHHQNEIFEALSFHIKVNDVHSIQPLLEMLSQFIHDLGPDFLTYYTRFLGILTELAMEINPNDAQNSRNSSNVLEWIFNCLAFAFKYLSKHLVLDLMPTFEKLLPLLKLSKKTYISRFCAEALSFLIRKSKVEGLTSILKFTFDDQIEIIKNNETYCGSLTTLYSESMKNTKGTFHSKSTLILSKIVENSLSTSNRDYNVEFISITSDILLEIIHHGSEESCLRFYVLVTDFLKQTLTDRPNTASFIAVSQLLAALSFSESGRKASWDPILSTVSLLLARIESLNAELDSLDELLESLSYFFVILFRNCEVQELTKYHHLIFTSMIKLNKGRQFLVFAESCCDVVKAKVINFGIGKYIQDYINVTDDEEQLKKAAFFLARLKLKNYYNMSPIPIISNRCQNSIISQLKSKYPTILDPNDLEDIYWRLLILRNGQITYDDTEIQYLINLVEQLIDTEFQYHSKFSQDITSVIIDTLSKLSNDEKVSNSLLQKLIYSLDRFQKSSMFIDSINQFILLSKNQLHDILRENYEFLTYKLVKNLCLPSHHARLSSIELLITVNDYLSKPENTFLHQLRIIEQIPLSLSSGRDITLRMRNLVLDFKKAESLTDFDQRVVINFMFGMLSNKFQPSWISVFEGLPSLIEKGSSTKYIWELAYSFIQFDYASQDKSYFNWYQEAFVDEESRLIEWQPRDVRLRENFIMIENKFISKYRNISHSLMEQSEGASSKSWYSNIMRSQSIKALAQIPSVAEKNSEKLVPILLNQTDENVAQDELDPLEETVKEQLGESHESSETASKSLNNNSHSWTLKDRNDLMSLFSKFRSLKKIHQSEAVYDHLLTLLCHKQLQVQKLALDVILNWKIGSINKYGDNLRNLLDETIFRDEIAIFITQDQDSKIEHKDLQQLMPLVLRILFGRVQGTPKSNSKSGKKFAVISILPNLSENDIIAFLDLGSEKLNYKSFFANQEERDLSKNQIRKINGYVNLLSEVYKTLGSKYSDVLSTTIRPLVYSLVVAQRRIETIEEYKEDDSVFIEKSARSIRQLGMRCLYDLFNVMGNTFSWDSYISVIYDNLVKPRMLNFAIENLQQPSSLMKIMLSWIDLPNTVKFLYFDEFAPTEAIASLFSCANAKDTVVSSVLEFSIKALSKKNVIEDDYFTLLATLVNSLLKNLPSIIDNISDKEIGSMAITVLLLLIEGNYIDDNETKYSLLNSLTKALNKPQSEIDPSDKANILSSLSSLVDGYDCSFDEILPLFETCSKSLRLYSDKRIRTTLVSVFSSIGNRFVEVEQIAQLLGDLNSYSSQKMQEYDFDRRLDAFKKINESLYSEFNPTQWLPILYCGLFFINDSMELAIRTNGTYMLKRFIDCISSKDNVEDAEEYLKLFKNIVLPYLKIGLRKPNEDIQSEYIDLLEHAVVAPKHFESLGDMKVLVFGDDDDLNFFKNVNNIQLHSRQQAVKCLVDCRHQLGENSISHFILPIIEHYALSKEEKFMGIGLQTLDTIAHLVRCVSWSHFKAIFKRYISNLKTSPNDLLKKNVNLIVAIAKAFMSSVSARRKNSSDDVIKSMPEEQEDIDQYVLKELFPPLLKVLVVRNDDTIVARAPLSEALCCLVMCISEDKIETELPSILTSTCQVMRSRSEELRDAIRKSLCKILILLGPQYLKFILQELKTALSRGSQIHVLSFTVHHLLHSISGSLVYGDLNDSLKLIIDIVMEDIFGAAGQEKDAEGYHSKMKEVKFKKSFDTGEIVSANINLSLFNILLEPIKLLLKENITFKTQNKLDELLRRYALGLNHNEEAAKKDILLLCYEINQMAFEKKNEYGISKPVNQSEDHFIVKLTAKTGKAHVSRNIHVHTLQKFSFELLRTALSRNDHLSSVSNLSGFIPLLEEGLRSDNEGVVVAALRILNSIIRLSFSEKETSIFETCTTTSLNIIKESPSTNSELCQAALKFLATTIRHKPEIELSESAIRYILVRVQPDLEEPNRQGLAFNFLKAVVSQHVMIPEVYDIMDKVSKIMVVNHSKEIRDMSRSVYYQFLMEYDQGRGKLEKQFKFLVNNLVYPTEAGRQSVMELIHLIIVKSGSELLSKLASSFFVSLANVLASDGSSKCREMASSLIASIFRKLDKTVLQNLEKYCYAWMDSSNPQLKRCGFNIYKIYISEFECGASESLDKVALDNLQKIIMESKNSEGDEKTIEWELLYSALNVFSTISSSLRDKVFIASFSDIWRNIIETLLFPHAWIRLISSRLIGLLLSNLDDSEIELSKYEVQTISYRLLRQLGAPSITEELGNQVIKNLVMIAMKWEANSTKCEPAPNAGTDVEGEANRLDYANDYLIAKTCSIMRQEHNYKDSFVSKKSSIKLSAMLVQITVGERIPYVAEKLLLALYNFTELNAQNSPEEEELVNLTLECMKMIEEKLGVTAYTNVYSKVKQTIDSRRLDRRTKRAQMALTAPDVAARRKLKKHERSRETRKHEKDENGYYRSKKRRFN